jgi:hypothetical protein
MPHADSNTRLSLAQVREVPQSGIVEGPDHKSTIEESVELLAARLGLARIKAAANDNGVPESAIVVCSDVPGTPTNADIEDLFAVNDYLRLYNWAFDERIRASDLAATDEPILKKIIDYRGGTDFDHALPAHELTRRRDAFFESVDGATLDNFVTLFELLNATVRTN